ncbi:tetratricopeptide repeat protein [Sphingomonas aerophila]|uniref:Tetratricopeptide (TPR) repeat protein n=1 Tax=Sphingomonas aerophila TaxID=1344948 RepID=A0A7W9BD57_9SPHN|nr:tetratricopeptide repeat protein [Sphingomonas aerophila]MBB5714992.1 tetratricopeptide (TPR) repeat protein [Sphingomonas aerophila]
MTALLLLLLAQAAPAPASDNGARCLDLVRTDPAAALVQAARAPLANTVEGGRCEGLANAALSRWGAAAVAFETAARAAAATKDDEAARLWAQAGNARLAGGDASGALAALDSAVAAGTLAAEPLGQVRLDRARARVATGDNDGAREDINAALPALDGDPVAWLLSATLARRAGDVPRARHDIGEALRRSPDDAGVQLEAGNIAALARDEAAARAAWAEAARLAPNGPEGRAALAALRQFDPASPQ